MTLKTNWVDGEMFNAAAVNTISAAINAGVDVHAAPDKATPVDADELALADSAATPAFSLKKLSWANVKKALDLWLKTAFLNSGPPIGGPAHLFNNNVDFLTADPSAALAAAGGDWTKVDYSTVSWSHTNWGKVTAAIAAYYNTATVSMSNKTITNPTVTTGTFTNPTISGAYFVLKDAANAAKAVTVAVSNVTAPRSVQFPDIGGQFMVRTANIPATATSPGTVGEVVFDNSFLYFCYAPNRWLRSTAFTTW